MDFYAPNDRQIGLRIPYEYGEVGHVYEPDFVARVRGGTYVLLEMKGGKGEIHDPDRVLAKKQAARKWVEAVNSHKAFGTWTYEFCHERELSQLEARLERHAAPAAAALPFTCVDAPPRGERFRTCVPLTTIRQAAGGFSAAQADPAWLLEWSEQWVRFEPSRPFKKNMFVAQVRGKSMEPKIPDGAYCLFGPAPAGSRQGRILIVAHAKINDPAYEAGYTVKRYRSEKVLDQDGNPRHARITLEPLNPAWEAIELTPDDEGEVRVVAELVEVVG